MKANGDSLVPKIVVCAIRKSSVRLPIVVHVLEQVEEVDRSELAILVSLGSSSTSSVVADGQNSETHVLP